MDIIEKIRALFGGGGSDDLPALRKRLAGAIETLHSAQGEVVRARTQHAAELLEMVGVDAPAAGASRSLEVAERNVQTLEAGIAVLRERIAQFEREKAEAESSRSWAAAEALQGRRVEAFERLQASLDSMADAFADVLRINEEAYAALPLKPASRPLPAVQGGIVALIEIYVHGRSGGKLGRVGLAPHVARQRPDLVATARDLAKQLLAADPRGVKGST